MTNNAGCCMCTCKPWLTASQKFLCIAVQSTWPKTAQRSTMHGSLWQLPQLSSLAYYIRHEAYKIAQRRKKAHDDGTAVDQWVKRPLLALTRADLEENVIQLVFNHLDERAFQDRLDKLYQVLSDGDDEELEEVRYG